MKIHFWLTSALVLVSAGASADPLAVGYGNTVTQTMPDGSKTIIYVNEDKTWEQHLANGTVLKGTFVEKDEHTVCFTLVDPAPKAGEDATNCNDIGGDHKVGDTWTQTTKDGKTITVAITSGR